MSKFQFDGSNLFIAEHTHVFPSSNVYFAEVYDETFRQTDRIVLVLDDFGNLVKDGSLTGAKSRHHFRANLH